MKRRSYLIILILLLTAFFLRIYHLNTQPLSGDEAFTITKWGTASIKTLLTEIASIDPQPPVALLSYHTWIQLAGHSEFAVRFLSALFSLIAVSASFALSQRIARHPIPLLVTLLCATNPFQIWYAQDARPYSEWMALSLLTLIAFLRALPSRRLHPWLIYISLAALSLHTFYLELFSFTAYNLYAIYYFYKTRHYNLTWLISQIAAICTLIPWLLFSKPQNSPYQPTASFPNIPPTITELIFNNTLPGVLTTPLFTGTNLLLIQILLLAGIAAAIFLLVQSNSPQHAHLIIFQTIIPILLLTILSIVTQKAFFRARYVAIAAIPLLVLITTITGHLYQKYRTYLAVYLFTALIMVLSLGSLTEYHFNAQYAKAPPWRDIAAILHNEANSDDIVILNYPDPAFPYYYSGPAATTILPSDENPPAELTISQLSPLPANHHHIWFLRVDTPFWDKQQIVATWLADNTAYLNDTWIGTMRLYRYASWEPTPDTIANRLDSDMGLAILRGYDINPSPPYFSLPQTLTIELFWQPVHRTTTDLRVFVHLISRAPDGTLNLLSQDDHPPQQGRLPTTTWPTNGAIHRDVYHVQLPPSLPDGTYTLATGFYDPNTSIRPPIPETSTQPEPNAVSITTIQISTQK